MTADQIRAAIAALQALLNEPPVPALGVDDVYLPVTGKVYPRPRPDLGELFVGYVQRVGAATGRSTSAVGSLFLGTGHLGDASDPANWPLMASKFFDARAYMTEQERAEADAGVLAWSHWRPQG